jgi:hypothetical protein
MFFIQKDHSQDDDLIKRGGSAGAAIAFWLALVLSFPRELNSFAAHSIVIAVIYALLCSGFIAVVTAAFGHFWGMDAAKCPSVNAAFLRGAKIAAAIDVLIFMLASIHSSLLWNLPGSLLRNVSIVAIFQLVIISAAGSLLSGLTAIYVRDYREFARVRRIPQFTLQEIFIVFTLVSVIISALTSITVMRV